MKFHRPVGAIRDMKELEYLVALHQSKHNDANAWIDGSIDASDMKSFLRSRYGIEVSKEEVRNVVLKGLAGGESKEDPCIDLMMIVSLLIIPLLVKVAGTDDSQDYDSVGEIEEMRRLAPPPGIIADVLKNILHDTLGEASEEPPELTPELLKKILLEHGEFDTLQDEEMVSKMIAMASGGGTKKAVFLDDQTFATALTDDVKLYDPKNETNRTTFLDDVFPEKSATGETAILSGPRINSSFSQVDFVADTVLSWQHVVLVWLTIVFSYFLYVLGVGNGGAPWSDPCKVDSYGCKVANAVVLWVQSMLKLVILGLVLGITLSSGNNSRGRNFIQPILGLCGIAGFIFFPAFHPMTNFYFQSDLEESGEVVDGFRYILVIFGCALTILQIRNLLAVSIDVASIPKSLKSFFAGSNGLAAFRSKQAGIYKVNQMVKNAYDLHKQSKKAAETYRSLNTNRSLGVGSMDIVEIGNENGDDGETLMEKDSKKQMQSTKAIALENYSHLMDETEEIGGFLWALKGFFSGSLQKTEGIWLSSRLIAACVIQIVATIIVFIMTVFVFGDIIKSLYPDPAPVVYSETCFSTFDYSKCYFPYGGGFYTGVGICRDVSLSGPDCLGLFDEIPLDTQFEQACQLLDAAYTFAADSIPSNWTCGEIFEWVDGTLDNSTYQEMKSEFNGCIYLNNADNITVAEWNAATVAAWEEASQNGTGVNATGPDIITDVEREYCRNMAEFVYGEVSAAASTPGANLSALALDVCLDIYEAVNSNSTLNYTLPSMCDRRLYRSNEAITTYELGYESETSYCSSFLSYCTPDPLNPTTGVCVIGERNLIPFRFEGSTCKNYPEINKTLAYYEETVAPTIQTITALMPEKWMVVLTAILSIVSGFGVAVATCVVYIPSSIHTLMKFRSGVIPSLRDPKFLVYRSGLENMPYLIGGMFWGLIITSLFISVLVAVAVFLLVWQISRPIVILLTAQVIGITITVILKLVVCKLFMSYSYAGYYRKKPTSANLFSLAMESWYLGLTLAFMLTRVVKFMLATSLYVGRIDRPVLADGLILDLDSMPRVYRQNLLSTESHRHPYIELLGLIYLMKLRHKDEFGTSPGTAWRLLFVAALMPWIKKKRIHHSLTKQVEQGEDHANVGEVAEDVIANVVAMNLL